MTTTVGDEEAATKEEGGDVSAARPVSVANQTQCCGKLKVAFIAVGSKHVIYKKNATENDVKLRIRSPLIFQGFPML